MKRIAFPSMIEALQYRRFFSKNWIDPNMIFFLYMNYRFQMELALKSILNSLFFIPYLNCFSRAYTIPFPIFNPPIKWSFTDTCKRQLYYQQSLTVLQNHSINQNYQTPFDINQMPGKKPKRKFLKPRKYHEYALMDLQKLRTQRYNMPLSMEESKVKLNETQLNKKAYEYQDENQIYMRSFYRELPRSRNPISQSVPHYESEYHNFEFKEYDNEMQAEYDL